MTQRSDSQPAGTANPWRFAQANPLLGRIIDSAPVGIAVIDHEGRYVSVNPAYAQLYDYPISEMLGRNFTMVFAEAQRQQVLKLHQAFVRDGARLRGEWEVLRRDGSQLTIISESVTLMGDDDAKLWLLFVVDISPRILAEKRLQKSESYFRTLASVLPVGIFHTNERGDCIYVNERWCDIAGISPKQAKGAGWVNAIHPEDRARVARSWYECAGKNQKFVEEYRFQRPDGISRWVLGQALEVVGATGEFSGYVGTITDISEHKRQEEELRQLATTDFLTGLFNRRSFIGRIEEEVARLQREIEQPVSLLMLDLDHFKEVNDSYGHATGDALLKHFAALLQAEVRRIDMAGRLGGEEFAIVLPGADLHDAKLFAERLCHKVASSGVCHNDQQISFTVSIGVTEIKAADGNADSVLARVDGALYQAKAQGRNRVVVI